MSFLQKFFGKSSQDSGRTPDPKSAKPHNKRAIAFITKGKFDEAIAECNQAIELDPNYAEAYSNRGLAFAKKNEVDRAIADLSKAIELNPRLVEAHFNKAMIYEQAGQPQAAVAEYKTFLKFAAGQNPVAIERAKAHIKALEQVST